MQLWHLPNPTVTWKNVLKCVILEECHTFLRLIKHRNLVYLGKDCGFTAQYLCNSLEKETHYELRFRGVGAIYTGKPLPRPVEGKIMTDLNDRISQRFPRHIEKPKIVSWATYIFNQNFSVSPDYKRRQPRKWIRIFPFLFKMFSLNPIRAGGPC